MAASPPPTPNGSRKRDRGLFRNVRPEDLGIRGLSPTDVKSYFRLTFWLLWFPQAIEYVANELAAMNKGQESVSSRTRSDSFVANLSDLLGDHEKSMRQNLVLTDIGLTVSLVVISGAVYASIARATGKSSEFILDTVALGSFLGLLVGCMPAYMVVAKMNRGFLALAVVALPLFSTATAAWGFVIVDHVKASAQLSYVHAIFLGLTFGAIYASLASQTGGDMLRSASMRIRLGLLVAVAFALLLLCYDQLSCATGDRLSGSFRDGTTGCDIVPVLWQYMEWASAIAGLTFCFFWVGELRPEDWFFRFVFQEINGALSIPRVTPVRLPQIGRALSDLLASNWWWGVSAAKDLVKYSSQQKGVRNTMLRNLRTPERTVDGAIRDVHWVVDAVLSGAWTFSELLNRPTMEEVGILVSGSNKDHKPTIQPDEADCVAVRRRTTEIALAGFYWLFVQDLAKSEAAFHVLGECKRPKTTATASGHQRQPGHDADAMLWIVTAIRSLQRAELPDIGQVNPTRMRFGSIVVVLCRLTEAERHIQQISDPGTDVIRQFQLLDSVQHLARDLDGDMASRNGDINLARTSLETLIDSLNQRFRDVESSLPKREFNPYRPLDPVVDRQHLHGRVIEAQALVDEIDHRDVPLVAISGLPGIGRTSLVRSVLESLPHVPVTAEVDAQQCARSSSPIVRLLSSIYMKLSHTCDLAPSHSTLTRRSYARVRRFFVSLAHQEAPRRVIVVLDHFDHLLRAVSNEEAIQLLQLLAEIGTDVRSVCFLTVMTTPTHLASMVYGIAPDQWSYHTRLRPLNPKDHEQLLRYPLGSFVVPYDKDALSTAYGITQGIPCLAQLLGQCAYEHLLGKLRADPSLSKRYEVTRADIDVAARTDRFQQQLQNYTALIVESAVSMLTHLPLRSPPGKQQSAAPPGQPQPAVQPGQPQPAAQPGQMRIAAQPGQPQTTSQASSSQSEPRHPTWIRVLLRRLARVSKNDGGQTIQELRKGVSCTDWPKPSELTSALECLCEHGLVCRLKDDKWAIDLNFVRDHLIS